MSDGAPDEGSVGVAPDGWPVPLRGVTESVVTTRGPNDRWNVAALGVHAPDEPDEPVTARTYGRTRTWRNFAERGGGVVQFTVDPRTFVDAALTVRETDDPVLPSADAWVEVRAEEVAAEAEGETTIRTWELSPVESAVVAERVPTVNRGFGAVVDATVAASRLDVPSFDTAELLDRLLRRRGGALRRAGRARGVRSHRRGDRVARARRRVTGRERPRLASAAGSAPRGRSRRNEPF